MFKNNFVYPGETGKARERRLKEGWFEKYAPEDLIGIDIGCGHDALNQTFRRYDTVLLDKDAHIMVDIPDNKFPTVYTSHLLEHMFYPYLALYNWYRITKPGGHLIIVVPHRDLYEKRKTLPSQWNIDHKHFWMPETDEDPNTFGLRNSIKTAIPHGEILSLRVIDDEYEAGGENDHPKGEYSIEAIVRKPAGL